MGKVTNRSAGLKRAPSGFALFCGHIAQTAAVPGIRLYRKQPEKNEKLQQHWKSFAKSKAESNSLARALQRKQGHGMKACVEPRAKASSNAEAQNFQLKLAWMGLPLKVHRLLGGGTYGSVYEVETVDKLRFAAKVLKQFAPADTRPENELHDLRDLAKEGALQMHCSSSPYIVPAIGMGHVEGPSASNGVCLLMRLCDAPLWSVLSKDQGVSMSQRLLWSVHVVAGLMHLHSQKVIHLDLKLDNILDSLRDKGAKVNLTLAADVWALGCVIFGIYTEKHLISDLQSYQTLCTKCIPETLAETLYPVMSQRVDRYLDQAVAAVVKKTVVPAPDARSKAMAVHKTLANLIGLLHSSHEGLVESLPVKSVLCFVKAELPPKYSHGNNVTGKLTEAVMEIADEIFMGKRQAMETLLEDGRVPPDWKPEPAQILGFKFSFKSASCVPWLVHQEREVWRGPRDAWEQSVEEVHRLGKDQQLARFASRGKLVLNSWDPANLAKIPLEKAPGGAGSSSDALPPPTADGLPCAMQAEAEDDTAGLLGLEKEPEQAAKKRRLSGPKLKKSREELMEEEVEKLQAKQAELLNSMKDPTQPMPTAAAVAKLQRAVGGKMAEAKEVGAYQVSTQLEELASQLTSYKEALKCTLSYLPANGHPKKNHADNFVTAMQKLDNKVLNKFPDTVVGHFASLVHQKDKQHDITEKNWQSAVEGIQKCEQVEKLESMVELLIANLLAEEDFEQLLSQHLPKLLEMTHLTPAVAESLSLLKRLLAKDLNGSVTFDGLLQELEAQEKNPVIRVLFGQADRHEKLVGEVVRQNNLLQGQFEKGAKAMDILQAAKKAVTESSATFCNCISELSQLHLEEADLAIKDLAADLQAMTKLVATKIVNVSEKFDLAAFLEKLDKGQVGKDDALRFFKSEEAEDFACVADILRKPKVLELLKQGENADNLVKEAMQLTNLHTLVSGLCLISFPSGSNLGSIQAPHWILINFLWVYRSILFENLFVQGKQVHFEACVRPSLLQTTHV
eukprot:s1039_g15.t1